MATLSSLLQSTLFPPSNGDVVGPGVATDNAIVRFDGTTGKLVQNSSVTIDDSGNMSITGGNITLGGTGRIQGVDTVSSSTDAVNKSYVDNAVASGVTTGKAIAMAIVFG